MELKIDFAISTHFVYTIIATEIFMEWKALKCALLVLSAQIYGKNEMAFMPFMNKCFGKRTVLEGQRLMLKRTRQFS